MKIGVGALETVQPRYQPLGCKDRGHGYGEQISVWLLRQGNALAELAEAALEMRQHLRAERRGNQALRRAGEKRASQLLFSFQNLLADGAN